MSNSKILLIAGAVGLAALVAFGFAGPAVYPQDNVETK